MHSFLSCKKTYRMKRVSSYDRTGGNTDWYTVEPRSRQVIFQEDGPGMIVHFWCTVNTADRLYLRKTVLAMYWDGELEPSVLVPLGDFFGLGHAKQFTYQCAPFSTSCRENDPPGFGVAMNCWLEMPFRQSARIEIWNESDSRIDGLYFYLDYRAYDELPPDSLYLHAQFRRENPCDGWTGEGCIPGSDPWRKRHATQETNHLTDDGNYLILRAEGTGHFIGVNFSIDHVAPGWWGEGDDMFFIDRDGRKEWPPDLHGTGTEDYLCQAWGMQNVSHLYSGQPWCEFPDDYRHNYWGKVCVYRYHILDPIPFERNIEISVEHGHANDRSDDFSSVAFWYQTEPHSPFPIPDVDARLPNPSF